MIYTSNYRRNGSKANAIGISLTTPKWFTGKHFPIVAPTWELINEYKSGRCDEQEYTKSYIKLLTSRGLTPTSIVNALPSDCILLCYEAPTDFCHRHVLAKWITQNTDIEIKEWKSAEELKKEQQQVFVDSLLEF